MKSYKIRKASYSNRKKSLEVETSKGTFTLPYSRLMTPPTSKNPIAEFFIDKELASTAVTYTLKDGTEDSVPLDAFLDFNKDPDFVRETELYRLTLEAQKLVKKSGISKRELARQMKTSMSQLLRILDQTNYSKTFDQLMKLFAILGAKVEIKVGLAA